MHESPAFPDLLVHPVSKKKLSYDGQKLSEPESGDQFQIKEGVAILLHNQEQPALTETIQHQQAGTQFHYKEHYQKDAAYFDYENMVEDPIEKEESRRLHQYIVSDIPEQAEWILDTGCGNGWLAKEMIPKGKKIISMDISDINPIKALKAVRSENHFGLVADVYELPLKENSMDCIVASEIIEHVPDPKLFIEKLLEVLKPGGRLIITTPYHEKIRYSQCIHCNRLTPHNAHLHSFTGQTLKQLVPSVQKIKTQVCNNKVLVKLRIQKLLSFLPFSLWKKMDQAANLVRKDGYRLTMVAEK